MGELRKDYFLDRYVIISPARSKRPHIVKHDEKEKESACIFCRGNEKKTEKELYRYPETGEWQIRSFRNRYAAVSANDDPKMNHDGLLLSSGSFGYHEVIVDTPRHDEDLWDLSEKRLYDVLAAYNERISHNSKKKDVRYVALFKNHGGLAGASIHHSHSQLIAYSQVPESVMEKERTIISRKNAYGKLIESEMGSPRRCFENEYFAAFCPFASRFPYELVIFPRRDVLRSTELGEKELRSLSGMMGKVLSKLKELGENYNFFFQSGIRDVRFHIEVMQRRSAVGGFEIATGCFINPVSPEQAAKFYRKR